MGGIFQNGIWTDGFDHYSDITQKWNDLPVGNIQVVTMTTPRFASAGGPSHGISFSAANPYFIGRTLNERIPEMYVGLAVNFGRLGASVGSNNNQFLLFYDLLAQQNHFYLALNPWNMRIQWYQGNPQPNVATGADSGLVTFLYGVWYYFEVHVIVSATNGLLEVRLNGNPTPIVQFIGNTMFSSTYNLIDSVRIGSISHNAANFFDDFYMLDMSGPAPYNTYLGDVRICTQMPFADSATGGLNTFTVTSPSQSSGNHYQNVDEAPPDFDTTYNADPNTGDRESYRLQSMSATGPVLATNTWVCVEKDDAATRAFSIVTRSGTTDNVGPAINTPSSYGLFNQLTIVDPSTGVAWTTSGVNAAEAGIEIVAGGGGGGGGGGSEDILNWMLLQYPDRTTSYMVGNAERKYSYKDADGVKFWWIKGSAGHPWDVHLYDSSYVYWWITENGDQGDWNVDTAYKRYNISAGYPTGQGVPLAPRTFTLASLPITTTTLGSNPIQRTENCGADAQAPINIGDIQGVLAGPYTIGWGGTVGTQTTLILNYYYSGSSGVYQNRERYYLVKNYGQVQWDHASLVSGSYVVNQTSTFNNQVTGTVPNPDFPCYTQSWWLGGTPGSGGNVP